MDFSSLFSTKSPTRQLQIEDEILQGFDEQERKELIKRLKNLEPKRREQLLSHRKLCKALCTLSPDLRFHALRFLMQEGALQLFIMPKSYPVEPTLSKISVYLKTAASPLSLPRLVRKLHFYLVKHGPLHMRGFIERFDLDHLARAFTTRVLHTLTLGEKLAFNIPLCIDPSESTAPWRDVFEERIRKRWLLSYIESPQRARPTPEAVELSARFNRFTDLNYRALHVLNLHDKTVGICLDCLRSLEDMLRSYLSLFFGLDESAPLEELKAQAIEAEIFRSTREVLEQSLRQELNVPVHADFPSALALPPLSESLLMAYDGEKANRCITADLRTLEPAERACISVAELINILHQKGLALGPGIFDRLRQAGGRVITEMSPGTDTQDKSREIPQPQRTNDFITFIDLRQSRQGGSIPFPVRVIVDAVTRNAGVIPDTSRLKLVIYASELETHLDIRIGGHSGRVHYSLAPPERGGRFALQYAEGSDEEGNVRRLQVMTRSFLKAGLKVTVTGQLLEAVYDKDCGATTLDAIREKAALGLQILNSMPDLDYALAGFNGTYSDLSAVELFGYFDRPAMEQLIEAWAQHCFENGFFFLDLLRPAKKGEDQFYHKAELYWDGRGPYTDPYRQQMEKYGALLDEALRESLRRVKMSQEDETGQSAQSVGQALFDRIIDEENRALRHSLLFIDNRGFVKANPVINELRRHPVTLFMDYLKNDEILPALSKTACLAEQTSSLGSWENSGKLGGLIVSRLRISIIKDVLSLFVLRVPETSRILLAFAAFGEDPLQVPLIDRVAERIRPNNVLLSPDLIALILSLFGYRVESSMECAPLTWSTLRDYLEQPNPPDIEVGSIAIPGIITSRGVVTGRFRANTPTRPPSDFQDGILVDHYLTPADDAKIQASRGVLITSGGELSHAAIRTREFQKPSIILKDVQYKNGALTYIPHYNRCVMGCYPFPLRELTVHACYCSPGNQEPIIAEDGDLVRLDAERGHFSIFGNKQALQQSYELILALEKHPHRGNLREEMNRQLETTADEDIFLFLLSEWVVVQKDLPLDRLRALLQAARLNPHHGHEVEEYLRHLLLDMVKRTDTFLRKQRVKIIRSTSLMELFYHLGAAVSRCERLENMENLFTGRPPEDTSPSERLSSIRGLAWGKIEQHRPALLEELLIAADKVRQMEDPEPRLLMSWERLLRRSRDAGLDREPHFLELTGRMARFRQRKEERIQLLRSCPEHRAGETCYLIPKEGLDSDFRPLAGGKAANSGEISLVLQGLEDGDICVPAGFATTTLLWERLQADPSILPALLSEPLSCALAPYLRAQFEHFGNLLEDRLLSSVHEQPAWARFAEFLGSDKAVVDVTLQKELEAFCSWLTGLEEIHCDAVLLGFARVFAHFAVRSSGTREDSCEESFAGQKLTILNVLGPIELCRSIGKVLASGAEAALVEEMIQAEVSGVAFSVHPGTGNFGWIVVNSAYGLGEGVVSGRVDPDTLVLDKKMGRPIGQAIPGRKSTRIVPAYQDIAGGMTTVEEPVPVELQRQLSLKERQQVLLSAAVRILEDHFDYPLDIEWAVDPLGRLFVLQSRPITTLWRTIAKGKELLAAVPAIEMHS